MQHLETTIESILKALHYRSEYLRCAWSNTGQRRLLQQNMLHFFRSAYEAAKTLKETLPAQPETDTEKDAAALVAALREYQGAYYAHRQAPTADNLADLESAILELRRMALRIRHIVNSKTEYEWKRLNH